MVGCFKQGSMRSPVVGSGEVTGTEAVEEESGLSIRKQ